MMRHKSGYLIHKSGCGWYRPNAEGYTLNKSEAGRFSYVDAVSYSHPNGPRGPRDGITFKHKSEVQGEEGCEKDIIIHTLKLERDFLRAAQEDLSQVISAQLLELENLKAELRGTQCAADLIARTCP